VNQAYVMGTSTVVDISGVTIPEHIDDKYFARVKTAKKGEEAFFDLSKEINPEFLAKRKVDQEKVDAELIKAIEKTPLLKEYLSAKFTLSNGEAPHMMKF